MIFLFVVVAGKRPFCSHTDTMPPPQRLDEGGRAQFHAILVTLFKLTFQKSLGRKPVRFAMRESMRGRFRAVLLLGERCVTRRPSGRTRVMVIVSRARINPSI